MHLCSTILDVISSIYHQDNANYFILESQCTLSQFAEKIHLKHEEIQVRQAFLFGDGFVTSAGLPHPHFGFSNCEVNLFVALAEQVF